MALSHVMNIISNAGIVGAGSGSGGGGGSGAIMGASMTAGYNSGYAFSSSGYHGENGQGSATDTGLLGQVCGQTGCICTTLYTLNSVMYLTITKSGFNGTFVNTGWTSLKLYLDQHNNTGTPDITIPRTDFTFSQNQGSGGGDDSTCTYSDNPYSISTYFGGSGNTKIYFAEIV